jgi:hypothetical protein
MQRPLTGCIPYSTLAGHGTPPLAAAHPMHVIRQTLDWRAPLAAAHNPALQDMALAPGRQRPAPVHAVHAMHAIFTGLALTALPASPLQDMALTFAFAGQGAVAAAPPPPGADEAEAGAGGAAGWPARQRGAEQGGPPHLPLPGAYGQGAAQAPGEGVGWVWGDWGGLGGGTSLPAALGIVHDDGWMACGVHKQLAQAAFVLHCARSCWGTRGGGGGAAGVFAAWLSSACSGVGVQGHTCSCAGGNTHHSNTATHPPAAPLTSGGGELQHAHRQEGLHSGGLQHQGR